MLKRNLSDDSGSPTSLPATRQKLEHHHTSRAFEPTALAVVSRSDLDDTTLDKAENIQRRCEVIKKSIAVVGSDSPALYNIVEPLLERIAAQVGNDDPLSTADMLPAKGSDTQAELLKLVIQGLDKGFATLRRLGLNLSRF